jgi:hypothetical protein
LFAISSRAVLTARVLVLTSANIVSCAFIPSFLVQHRGQSTALHFCFAFGFHELAEYLVRKGADDTILNSSGLSCYEGLGLGEGER